MIQPFKLDRRRFLGAASSATLALNAQFSFAIADSTPPNFLLILTDQHHAEALSCAGNASLQTPALDALALRGTQFTQAYCTSPLCSPARSSLFTGRMPSDTGVIRNGRTIHPSIPTLGPWLQSQASYQSFYAGKWHLPHSATASIPGYTILAPGINGQGQLGDGSVSEACAGFLLHHKSNEPFFLTASLTQPHDICQWLRLNAHNQAELRYPSLAESLPPLPANFSVPLEEPQAVTQLRHSNEPAVGKWEELHWRYYLWSYYRMVEMADAEIGRILDALEGSGLAENTVVLFTADHGEGCAHHQMVRKSSPYEESVKVPFLVSSPTHIRQQAVNTERLVSGLDLFPTLCDFAGCKTPEGVMGQSLRPWLEGSDKTGPESILIESFEGQGLSIRSHSCKYTTFVEGQEEQLFDLQTDPGETRNQIHEPGFAAMLDSLRRQAEAWRQRNH